MSVIQIRKAEREGSKLVFAFAGWTGEGKTVTAILFGYGLAGYDASKVGFIDAENRRGSLCADTLENATRPTKDRFLIGDLYAPFSPERYSEAIEDMQAAGVEVCIIDSVTHEWEGLGGCQEIAEAGNPKIPRWELAKGKHKRFMNKLLQSDMHIIVCVRAREKVKPEKKNGKTEFVDYGLQPIQEKNFMFEMTASLMMYNQGRQQSIIKCPAALVNYLGRKEGYITSDDGYAVRQWVNGALKLDPTVEKYKNRLQSNTEGGVEHIKECWNKTPGAVQEALGKAFYETLVKAATAYEEHARISAEGTEGNEGGDGAPAGGNPAEQAEADAIANKARTNGAAAAATMQASTPQTSVSPGSAASGGLPPEKPAEKAAQAATTAPAAAKAPEQAPPVQQKLAPPITGVLPGDPVF
jgi:hypothetical protein